MARIDYKQLCLSLLNAESEAKVIQVLEQYNYWHSEVDWRKFGDKENNWSLIGNQQSNPVAAMVEKLINSIDAVLMRECYRRDINPEGSLAPGSIADALELFFGIHKGNLANITASERSIFAQEIGFVATGRRSIPNYTVFDLGEGQTPTRMPDTLLSLTESNKLRIPFVQGKFNMGGTGVLPFCGKHNLQLIISRRCPEIANRNISDWDHWGFTIVRREEPRYGRRSSMFTYLAPDGDVPTFFADVISIPDSDGGTQSIDPLKWGTIIKMYEYEMSGLKTNILFDLYNQISLALPKPGLPIRFYERRKYKGHSLESTMAGLHVRLQDDKRNNLEPGFPTSHPLNISGQTLKATVYAFQKGQSEKYIKSEGVVFTINGQTHGVINQRFFSSQKINMGYIANELLVLVDASDIQGRAREDLFMNSRDRLRRGDLYTEIESSLQELLRSHQGLKELRERRRREAIENRLSDQKPLQEVLDDILRKSPTLSALFVQGVDIGNPLKSKLVSEDNKFEGKRYPSFFNILDKDISRKCELGRRFRVQFETDVVNDYFERDNDPGEFVLYEGSRPTKNFIVNLWNGTATLTVALQEDVQVGDHINYRAVISDPSQVDPFVSEFERLVVDQVEHPSTKSGDRKPPRGNANGHRKTKDTLSLPNVIEVREPQWDDYGFDKYSSLGVINAGNGTYDYFINMDNVYLQAEIKSLSRNQEPELTQARFKYAFVLIGLSLIRELSQPDEDTEDEESVERQVHRICRALSPIILPAIDALGDLTIDNLSV